MTTCDRLCLLLDEPEPADLVGLGLRLLAGGCRADSDTLCAETAGMVSMAGMCHRSGRAQDDLKPRKLPAARLAVAVPGSCWKT
jgi:hypothetical protein